MYRVIIFIYFLFYRIGLVFVVNSDPEVDGLADPGVAILRAFNYIRKNDNAVKALSFITDVSTILNLLVCHE